MHPSLEHTDHRPWPLPSFNWKWRQSWLNLAFLHYPVNKEEIEKRIPNGISVDLFEGTAWIGLVPFMMSGVMRRPLPDLPLFSSFPELNLRTYVTVNGKPGVWFFSLDADSFPIVLGGRVLYNLPYHYAKQKLSTRENWTYFRSHRDQERVRFHAKYRPKGKEFYAEPGTFEHWATERYCLYSSGGNNEIQRVEVHHAQWPLQRAEVAIEQNEIIDASGIIADTTSPRYHYSRGVHVISYDKESCANETVETMHRAVPQACLT